MKTNYTLTCSDKEDAKDYLDELGEENVLGQEVLDNGKVVLYLRFPLKER